MASAKVQKSTKILRKIQVQENENAMLLQKGFDLIVAFCMYVCNFATHLEVSFFCSPSERKIVFASKISWLEINSWGKNAHIRKSSYRELHTIPIVHLCKITFEVASQKSDLICTNHRIFFKDISRVLLRHQMLKLQLSHQKFVIKLFIFSSLFFSQWSEMYLKWFFSWQNLN